jgi:hypothetical protein
MANNRRKARGKMPCTPRKEIPMERDPYADMFRFQMGQCVHWAEYPHERHYIGQRRWTQREILEPLVEYHLRLGASKGGWLAWVNERELLAWDEDEPR